MEKEFYQKLYNLSLDHRVRFNPNHAMDRIKTYIEAIGQGNGYYPKKVLTMIEQIDTVIPRIYYNENNPNNGSRLWEIEIGREGSPVIYIIIKVKSLGKYHIQPGLDTTVVIETCKEAARDANADEITHEIEEDNTAVNGYKEIILRFWWD